MPEELPTITLENGLVIHFYDQSNRYFGDFHRVCIKVSIALSQDLEISVDLSETGCFERTLEKMGVPSADLDTVRNALIDAFLTTSRAYLERPDFPEQLLRKMQQDKKPPTLFRGRNI